MSSRMGWSSFFSRWFPRKREASDLRVSFAEQGRLKQEQRVLADEIEMLFRTFDQRLQDFALHADSLTETDFERQAEGLRAAQDGLRVALRRLESSMKGTRELERELAEWEGRMDGGTMHADHSDIRAEIIRSELAIRGVRRDVPERFVSRYIQKCDEMQNAADEETTVSPREKAAQEQEEDIRPREYVFRAHDPVRIIDADRLVQAIREATHEAERWHALPLEVHDADATDQIRHLRELHAILKRLDREHGVVRDRLELAVNPRDIY